MQCCLPETLDWQGVMKLQVPLLRHPLMSSALKVLSNKRPESFQRLETPQSRKLIISIATLRRHFNRMKLIIISLAWKRFLIFEKEAWKILRWRSRTLWTFRLSYVISEVPLTTVSQLEIESNILCHVKHKKMVICTNITLRFFVRKHGRWVVVIQIVFFPAKIVKLSNPPTLLISRQCTNAC